jgi:hypothetical protein
MPGLLQVRVSVFTYRPADVLKTWPKLSALAWPPEEMPRGEMRHDAAVGVVELAELIASEVRYGKLDPAVKEALRPGLARVDKARAGLEEALAAWKPQEANQAAEALEEALSELEKAAPRPVKD